MKFHAGRHQMSSDYIYLLFLLGQEDLLGSFNDNDIDPPSYEAARDLLGLDENYQSKGINTSYYS